MELKRDDIIKALECGVRQNCDGCPLYDALGDSDGACLDIMPPNILSLIKELTEENERLRAEGEWLDTGDRELDTIYSGYKCSVCGFIICGHSGKYCSECGAKMKGE
jgi:hypothetical protein